jgi:hypothetical protein
MSPGEKGQGAWPPVPRTGFPLVQHVRTQAACARIYACIGASVYLYPYSFLSNLSFFTPPLAFGAFAHHPLTSLFLASTLVDLLNEKPGTSIILTCRNTNGNCLDTLALVNSMLLSPVLSYMVYRPLSYSQVVRGNFLQTIHSKLVIFLKATYF